MSTRPAPPPVVDNNPPRRRPAPDATPPPAPAPDAKQPGPDPAEATNPPGDGRTAEPTVEASRSVVEHQPDQPAATLASKLASNTGHSGQGAGDAAAMLLNLAAMRQQQVDPMLDYVNDGTRLLRWVQATVQHAAALTGKSQQDIMRDALLGVAPLPAELLDAHYQLSYGRPRRS